jgi:site-specific DNA-methyltransferase (adenine-specific)
MYRILEGDVVEQLKTLADASVDAIVTDPPYELGFMGKAWDQSGIACNVEMWQEALRVLKPGGHCLAFGGSRTYHRLACAIEDAGFEIRDQIMWIYGSGFPKSLDVSKAIDKAAGACREVVGVKPGHKDFADRSDAHSAGGRSDGWERPWKQDADAVKMSHMQTAPATDAAKQWSGWGTALKPAHEPIVVARKPLIGTVAANVLEHGTGALNIDGCRVETNESTVRPDGKCAHGADPHSVALGASWDGEGFSGGSPLGR